MVEFDCKKREYLSRQFKDCEHLFCDMAEMGKDKAMTHAGFKEEVPKALVFRKGLLLDCRGLWQWE